MIYRKEIKLKMIEVFKKAAEHHTTQTLSVARLDDTCKNYLIVNTNFKNISLVKFQDATRIIDVWKVEKPEEIYTLDLSDEECGELIEVCTHADFDKKERTMEFLDSILQ